ncbi:MAG: BolA family transcriptional regulator [Gammaproteobacteria bacterium]|nr:BolA family transcriptional regulator [Gammaproteobacteria bacterium]
MIAEQRQEAIEQRLQQTFNPSYMEVIDESHLHIGHVGAQGGKGHFRVIITSTQFTDQPLLLCHRLIYQALGEMMTDDIHALAIEIKH